ncbi:MAG TPA: HD domain-containing phosphohydrolase [Blastocatellia bacterium]|nr:HD domain-containing phosphohydrolase [Blastocatellia bacterium]
MTSILIVDDDIASRTRIDRYLAGRYDCTAADSAAGARALLATARFDLVLTAINAPHSSGLELCRFVSETYPDAVVIVISATADTGDAVKAMRYGAFDCITTPFDLARLVWAVERAAMYQDLKSARRRHEDSLEEKVRLRTAELTDANLKLSQMVDTLYRTYRSTLRGLAKTLEARDLETRGHSDRVVAYSLRLAHKVGVDSADLIGLEQGALLHDIGKIGVRDSVLLKNGALTDEEWRLMRQHVEHGLKIVEGISFLQSARFVIGQHHERYDGSGYPHRLKHESIHINARIFAVADAFDAITSNRPYRAGRCYEDALREILAYSGSQFDPGVVNAFVAVPSKEWAEIRRTVEATGETEAIAKDQLQSFVLGLNCSEEATGHLTQLVS